MSVGRTLSMVLLFGGCGALLAACGGPQQSPGSDGGPPARDGLTFDFPPVDGSPAGYALSFDGDNE